MHRRDHSPHVRGSASQLLLPPPSLPASQPRVYYCATRAKPEREIAPLPTNTPHTLHALHEVWPAPNTARMRSLCCSRRRDRPPTPACTNDRAASGPGHTLLRCALRRAAVRCAMLLGCAFMDGRVFLSAFMGGRVCLGACVREYLGLCGCAAVCFRVAAVPWRWRTARMLCSCRVSSQSDYMTLLVTYLIRIGQAHMINRGSRPSRAIPPSPRRDPP